MMKQDLEVKQMRAAMGALPDMVVRFYRQTIDIQVAEASKTRRGLPTGAAISSRWWIEQFEPDPDDSKIFHGCMPNCCQRLGLDLVKERERCLAHVDEAWSKAAARWGRIDLMVQVERFGMRPSSPRQLLLELAAA